MVKREINGLNILCTLALILILSSNIPLQVSGQTKDNFLTYEHKTGPPRIGINIIDVTQEIAGALGLEKPTGILVVGINPGGPAEKAGIVGGSNEKTIFVNGTEVKLGGDIILKEDNITVTNNTDIQKILSQKKVGDNLKLTLLREGKILDVNITLEQIPEFKIKYPSDWRVNRTNDNFVQFNTSSHGISDDFQDNLRVGRMVNIPFISFIMLSPLFPNILKNALTTNPDANVTVDSVEPTNIGQDDLPGYKIMTTNNDKGLIGMGFLILSMQSENANPYIISYSAKKGDFANYLPIAQKMIDSFEITK